MRETSRSKHMGKSVNLAVVSFRFSSSLRMLDQSDGTYIAQVVICRHRSLVAFAVSAAPRTSHKQGRFCAGRSAYRDGRRCVHRREGPRPVYCTSFAQGERHPQTHHVIHAQPSIRHKALNADLRCTSTLTAPSLPQTDHPSSPKVACRPTPSSRARLSPSPSPPPSD